MIKPPCTQNCDKREVGCHSEKCPYGWMDYEKRKLEQNDAIRAQKSTYVIYDSSRQKVISKGLYNPLRPNKKS